MPENQSRSKQEKKSRVLQDHKRVGSRFIPPALARMSLTEISYVRDLLPELVWIRLAIGYLSDRDGIKLCAAAAETAKKIHQGEKFINLGLCSSWEYLSDTERQMLLDALAADQLLVPLQKSVEPLIALYAACPMSFLGLPTDCLPKEQLIQILRECVGDLIDKYQTSAMAAQSALLYIRSLTGGLYFSRDIEPPDLDAIITRPDSEAAQRAAGMVRASVLQEIMPRGTERVSTWARTFWNEAIHIDSCEFQTQDYDD